MDTQVELCSTPFVAWIESATSRVDSMHREASYQGNTEFRHLAKMILAIWNTTVVMGPTWLQNIANCYWVHVCLSPLPHCGDVSQSPRMTSSLIVWHHSSLGIKYLQYYCINGLEIWPPSNTKILRGTGKENSKSRSNVIVTWNSRRSKFLPSSLWTEGLTCIHSNTAL